MCFCAFGCSDCENRNNLIYLLYNDKGFGYIGKTTHLHTRLKLHRHKKNECGSKKLGEFKYIVLESNIESDYLSAYEQYYYDMYNEMYGGKLVNLIRPNGESMDYYERRNDLKKLEHYRTAKVWNGGPILNNTFKESDSNRYANELNCFAEKPP